MTAIKFGHPLYGAELRLARARRLIGTLHRQYARWAALHESSGIQENFDRATGVLRISAAIHEDRKIHIPRMSITLGEIAYNVRSSLDFLVYSIARANNANYAEVDGTQFPMEDSPERFWMRWTGKNPETGKPIPASAKWLKNIPKGVAEDLEHYQPFASPWVAILRDISNRDKHRHLTTLTISTNLLPEGPIRIAVNPVKNAQSIHYRGQIEIGVFLPTGEDVIDAANLVQSEATALIRRYASRFTLPGPRFV
jgi:hypothetical protein